MTVTVQRAQTEYYGCHIDHVVEVPVKSVTATISETDKAELSNGKLALDLITYSYAYGDEIQLNYYTHEKPIIRKRVDRHNGWYRVEIHMTKQQAAQLVKGLMK